MNRSTLAPALIVALCLAQPAIRADASAAPNAKTMCLTASHIKHTAVVSDTVVLYYMNDGKVWQNTLQKACPNLKFENAFSEAVLGDAVCANAHMIQVLRHGTLCSLGDFTPYTPPPPAPAN